MTKMLKNSILLLSVSTLLSPIVGRRGEREERYWRSRIRSNNMSRRRRKQTTTKYADEDYVQDEIVRMERAIGMEARK